MHIHSPLNREAVGSFKREGLTHYRMENDGTASLLTLTDCECCGRAAEGANSVHLTKECLAHQLSVTMMKCHFEQTSVSEELGCTEAGECVCSDCASRLEQPEPIADLRHILSTILELGGSDLEYRIPLAVARAKRVLASTEPATANPVE